MLTACARAVDWLAASLDPSLRWPSVRRALRLFRRRVARRRRARRSRRRARWASRRPRSTNARRMCSKGSMFPMTRLSAFCDSRTTTMAHAAHSEHPAHVARCSLAGIARDAFSPTPPRLCSPAKTRAVRSWHGPFAVASASAHQSRPLRWRGDQPRGRIGREVPRCRGAADGSTRTGGTPSARWASSRGLLRRRAARCPATAAQRADPGI